MITQYELSLLNHNSGILYPKPDSKLSGLCLYWHTEEERIPLMKDFEPAWYHYYVRYIDRSTSEERIVGFANFHRAWDYVRDMDSKHVPCGYPYTLEDSPIPLMS